MVNGNIFKGTFKDGEFHSGILTYSNGTSYEGKWVDGHMEGKGTFHASEKTNKPKRKRKSKTKKDEKDETKKIASEPVVDNNNFSETISGFITEDSIEYGENKLYKTTQLYPMANNLPLIDFTSIL